LSRKSNTQGKQEEYTRQKHFPALAGEGEESNTPHIFNIVQVTEFNNHFSVRQY